MRIIGLMSGTSADGIAACLADVREQKSRLRARCLEFITVPYPAPVRRRVLNARTVEDVCRLNFELGELFAQAALKLCTRFRIDPRRVAAIGSHGQTLFHVASGPHRSTLQIGEPCVIAERTGITTVADFRTRDIAAGGSGAPLVPIVDYLLLRSDAIDRVALNIGGIANITVLPARCSERDVVAFDIGPGNMVIDGLVELLTDGRRYFDRGGRTAARGAVSRRLLTLLHADPYYPAPPPKSTGREKFGLPFAQLVLDRGRRLKLSDEDILATATALTAHTIAEAINRQLHRRQRRKPCEITVLPAEVLSSCEIITAGGGIHNRTLMTMLQQLLPSARITTTESFGIPADAKEALAFAVLAWLTLHDRPGDLPGATGVRSPVVLGKIVPGRGKILTG